MTFDEFKDHLFGALDKEASAYAILADLAADVDNLDRQCEVGFLEAATGKSDEEIDASIEDAISAIGTSQDFADTGFWEPVTATALLGGVIHFLRSDARQCGRI
jgi:hypothetical protein